MSSPFSDLPGVAGEPAQARPLVGRERELRLLLAVLEGERGAPGAAVLEGEPGTGKSRLLDELCARSRATGRRTESARALPGDREVPGALLLAIPWPGAVRELMEQYVAGAVAGRPDPVHRHRWHRRLHEALTEAARAERFVLLLDDLQWADRDSLLLLDHLAAARSGGRAVVLAHRSGQRPAALARSLADPATLRLALAPLAPAEAAALLPDAPAGHRQLLLRVGAGNPRQLRALAALSPGVVAELAAGHPARAAAAADWPVDPELGAEVESLSEPARLVLRAAAVAGAQYDLALVAEVAELPPGVAGAALDELVAHGCVEGAAGRYRSSRPLLAATAYRLAGPAWRTAAHRRAADHLGRIGAPLPLWAAQAEHLAYAAAKNDLARLVGVARLTLLDAPADSARWLATVLRVLPAEDRSTPLRGEAAVLLGQALTLTGRLDEAAGVLAPLLAQAGPHRAEAAVAAALVERLRGRTDRAHGLLAGLAAEHPPHPGDRAQLWTAQLRLARIDLMNGHAARCLARLAGLAARPDGPSGALPAVAADAPSGPDQIGWQAPDRRAVARQAVTGLALISQGRVAAARRVLDQAEPAVDALADRPVLQVLGDLPDLCWAGLLLERQQRTARRIDRAIGLAERHGHRYVLPHLHTVRAALLLMTGPLEGAVAAADAALLVGGELGTVETLGLAAALRLRALLWSEGPAAAGPALALSHSLPEPPMAGWRAVVRLARLEAAIACGEPVSGERTVKLLGLDDARRGGDPMPAHGHDLAAARYAAQGDAAMVARHARAAELTARAGALPSGLAVATLTAARSWRADGDLPRAGATARRAASRLTASGLLARAGLAHLMAAEIAGELGDGEGRESADAAARELFARVGAHALAAGPAPAPADSPVAARAGGDPLLSGRESEVADLVAQGLTNRAIAARLYVSVRTVETHLTSLYRKLGISSRAAVARAMDTALGG
ncbi:helix-turn-helix transcriptional regulator [Kitasatospora viridis]|uniref:Regulatory LuxR family protein n=1 Tax=Kitasatospora viridis TaxID=281105 RepID=A0A561TSQ0_9ACTN|nr:LuxR family transcriptional regulator [Kitasatospora viridis]TWF90143.1 regulatory LuxR family protein [Kitasatospora viridis]